MSISRNVRKRCEYQLVQEQRAAHSLEGQKSGHREPGKAAEVAKRQITFKYVCGCARAKVSTMRKIGTGASLRAIPSVYIHVCLCVCSQLSTYQHVSSSGQEQEDTGAYLYRYGSLVHSLKANGAMSPRKNACRRPPSSALSAHSRLLGPKAPCLWGSLLFL